MFSIASHRLFKQRAFKNENRKILSFVILLVTYLIFTCIYKAFLWHLQEISFYEDKKFHYFFPLFNSQMQPCREINLKSGKYSLLCV